MPGPRDLSERDATRAMMGAVQRARSGGGPIGNRWGNRRDWCPGGRGKWMVPIIAKNGWRAAAQAHGAGTRPTEWNPLRARKPMAQGKEWRQPHDQTLGSRDSHLPRKVIQKDSPMSWRSSQKLRLRM
jgi:hypothetical protein